MNDPVEVMFTARRVSNTVAALARQISMDYAGRELLVVAVLKGAFVFCADLVRRLTVPATVDFIACCSYGRPTEASGVVRILKDLDANVEGRNVLLVEDIVDSGLTLRYLLDYISRQRPASLATCVLLDRPSHRRVPVPVTYRGFTIPEEFVVGYGLDWQEQYRHLPYLGKLRRPA